MKKVRTIIVTNIHCNDLFCHHCHFKHGFTLNKRDIIKCEIFRTYLKRKNDKILRCKECRESETCYTNMAGSHKKF